MLYFLVVPILLAGVLLPARSASITAVGIVVGASVYEYLLDHEAGEALNAADASLVLLLTAVALLSIVAATFAGRDARLLDARTASLEKARGELEGAAKERQRMFNQVAHDLANPLTPLAVQVKILEMKGADPAPLAVARRSIGQLQRQVEDLRDLGRVEAGAMRLKLSPNDLGQLAADACDSFASLAKDKGIRWEFPMSPGPTANVDPERITQVLVNLLSNAVKFTPAGGAVRVEVARDGEDCRVTVHDTGRGLSLEETERLFKPFMQAHAAGEVKERGSGLGLFIARGIALAHGGDVTVDSAGHGAGSTFTLRLPVAPDASAAPPTA